VTKPPTPALAAAPVHDGSQHFYAENFGMSVGVDGALGITCPDCHAPVGVGCVNVVWRARAGRYLPDCEPRRIHTRRRKLLAKFGPSNGR